MWPTKLVTLKIIPLYSPLPLQNLTPRSQKFSSHQNLLVLINQTLIISAPLQYYILIAKESFMAFMHPMSHRPGLILCLSGVRRAHGWESGSDPDPYGTPRAHRRWGVAAGGKIRPRPTGPRLACWGRAFWTRHEARCVGNGGIGGPVPEPGPHCPL